jgi:hypothetical protein
MRTCTQACPDAETTIFKEEASDPVIDCGSFVWWYDSINSRGSFFRNKTFRVGSLGDKDYKKSRSLSTLTPLLPVPTDERGECKSERG